jgi:hypothetical protein
VRTLHFWITFGKLHDRPAISVYCCDIISIAKPPLTLYQKEVEENEKDIKRIEPKK